jgi:hypothetical protein
MEEPSQPQGDIEILSDSEQVKQVEKNSGVLLQIFENI